MPFLAETLSVHRLPHAEGGHSTAAAGKEEGDCDINDVPFYVLNLDRRRDDKLWAMQKVIERDVPWMCKQTCRVSAPDGRLWSLLGLELKSRIISSEAWQDIRRNAAYGLTPGGVALMAGHGKIWEHILQDKAPFAVVMEDDLMAFHPDTKKFLCRITKTPALQEGWDFMIMQMGFMGIYNSTEPPTLKRNEHVHNTGMYIMKLDAARKALQNVFPITKYVQLDDRHSAFWSKLRGAHTIPAIADASHETTDVQVEEYSQRFDAKKSASRCSIHDCQPLNSSRMVVPELLVPTKE